MYTIQFKSTPDNYWKEREDIKNNTVRKVTDEEKFRILKELTEMPNFYPESIGLEIINRDTQTSFKRVCRDVTFYEDIVIFTWTPEKEKKNTENELIELLDQEEDVESYCKAAAIREETFQRTVKKYLVDIKREVGKLNRKQRMTE
jgi:hypothetical protein